MYFLFVFLVSPSHITLFLLKFAYFHFYASILMEDPGIGLLEWPSFAKFITSFPFIVILKYHLFCFLVFAKECFAKKFQ